MEVGLSESNPRDLLAGLRQRETAAIENLIRITYKELRR